MEPITIIEKDRVLTGINAHGVPLNVINAICMKYNLDYDLDSQMFVVGEIYK